VYKEFGYSLEKLDEEVLKYIQSFDLSVKIAGKDFRVPPFLETPDELYAKNTIPCISVHSGYKVTTPDAWYLKDTTEQIDGITGKNRYLEQRLVTLYYTYKIGYLVTDFRHDRKMMTSLSLMFPKMFNLEFVDGEDSYVASFYKEQPLITMDEIVSGQKIYRKDTLLTAKVTFEYLQMYEYLQAQGVEFELDLNIT